MKFLIGKDDRSRRNISNRAGTTKFRSGNFNQSIVVRTNNKLNKRRKLINKSIYPRQDLAPHYYSKFGVNRNALTSFDEPRGKHEKHEFVDTFDGESAFQYAVRCRLMGLTAVVWKKHDQSQDSIFSTYVVSVHKDENFNDLTSYQRKKLMRKEGHIRKSFSKYDKRRLKDFVRRGKRPKHNMIDKYDRSVTADLPRKA